MNGYSNKPLYEKLGIKKGYNILLANESKLDMPYYLRGEIEELELSMDSNEKYDFVHLFHDNASLMKKGMISALERIKSNGMIWISWPKKASKIKTDITEDIIRDYAISIGLVDVKVCSVSEEVWSGLKLVIRIENRIKE